VHANLDHQSGKKKNGVESGFSKRLLGGSEGFNSDIIHLIFNDTFDAMAKAEKSLTCLSKEKLWARLLSKASTTDMLSHKRRRRDEWLLQFLVMCLTHQFIARASFM